MKKKKKMISGKKHFLPRPGFLIFDPSLSLDDDHDNEKSFHQRRDFNILLHVDSGKKF